MIYKKALSVIISFIILLMCAPLCVNAYVRGDANNDGVLSVRDAAYIAGCLSKRREINKSADYNGDGKVDIRDASAIASVLVTPYADYAKQILMLVNQERAQVGLSPLTLNLQLTNAANVRAEEISEFFSHTRPDNTSFSTVLNDFSIKYYCCGENIAAGCTTADFTMQQWVNSPDHYANIINSDYTELGVGYYYDENSTYKHHWVQLFKCN